MTNTDPAQKPIPDVRREMLCIVRPKACQRCGGDLSIECDIYGVYIECIQCGANWTRNDVNLKTIRKNNEETKASSPPPAVTAPSR